MSLEPGRVVLVWAQGPATAKTGSGYLLTPRLVLTARHVLSPLKEHRPASRQPRCTVRPLRFTESAVDYEAQIAWSADDLDIALVRVTDPRWRSDPVRQTWWAPVTGTEEVSVTGLGFPRFQRDDTEQLLVTDDGGRSALRRSLLQRRQIDDLLELGVADSGRLAVVTEVDPYALRITGTPYGGRGYRRDPYVARDSDELLRTALR